MNNNIIAPTIVNGITITVMAVIGFTAVVLIAQLFHLGVNMGGSWGGSGAASSSGGY